MSKIINGDNYLSYAETSERLGMPQYTVANWVSRGKLHSIKIPGIAHKYIAESEVNTHMPDYVPSTQDISASTQHYNSDMERAKAYLAKLGTAVRMTAESEVPQGSNFTSPIIVMFL